MSDLQFETVQKLRNNGQTEKAVAIYKNIRAECLHMIGVAYYQTKEFGKAETYLKNCLKEFREQKNNESVGFVFRDLGMVYLEKGDLKKSQDYLVKSVNILKKSGNVGHEGISRVKLGRLFAKQKKFNKATQLTKEGILLLTKSKENFFLSTAYFDYAKLLLIKGQTELARNEILKSLKILDQFWRKDEFLERRKEMKKLLDEIK